MMETYIKILFVLMIIGLSSTPCFAASCPDAEAAAGAAMQNRNQQTRVTYNAAIQDPEEDREALGGCLDTIHSIGDVFSLGVTVPGMDQVVSGMCGQVNSHIQDKINEALGLVEQSASGFGQNNPFQVSGNAVDLVKALVGQIR